jgi:hypothetical protein
VVSIVRAYRPGGTLTAGSREKKSPFRWENFRQPFLDALTAGTAESFCITWLDQLGKALRPGMASLKSRQKPALGDTVDNLALLLEWWLPARETTSAEDAAKRLRAFIQSSLFLSHLQYVGVSEEALDAGTKRDYEIRSERTNELRDDVRFVASIAARLVAYDPRMEANPSRALRDAVREEIERGQRPARENLVNPLGLKRTIVSFNRASA